MTMNIRLIKYWLCGALLVLTSCADEELVQPPSGNYRDGDPVTLNFTVSVPRAEEVAMTRAAVDEDKVEDLTLLVFSGQEGTDKLEQVVTTYSGYTGTEFEKSTLQSLGDNRYKFAAPLEASTEDKGIYIIANAGAQLFGNGNTLEIGSTTLTNVKALKTDPEATVLTMSGSKLLPIPHADLLTKDFPLTRNHAKVTVEVAEELQDKFTLEGFYLCNGQKSGSILAGAFPAERATVGTDPNFNNDWQGGDVSERMWKPFDEAMEGYVKTGLYTTPCQNESVKDNKGETQVFLLIRGTYTEEGQQPVTYYYHADFERTDGQPMPIGANYHYKVTITEVERIGYKYSYRGFVGAYEGATNAIVDIQDIYEDSRNMASDGVTEIGVQNDTLWIEGTDKGAKVEFEVTASPSIRGNGDSFDGQFEFEYDEAAAPWLQIDDIDYNKTTKYTIGDQEYSVTTVSFSTKTANPAGERREARVGISCRGVMTYVTVIQEPEFCADQFGMVSLKVKEYERNAEDWIVTSTTTSGPYQNYWQFIRGTDGTNKVYGISPEDMGGKVRTEGFHAPMSDFQQFVYTFTVPSNDGNCSWHIELDDAYKDKLLFWQGSESTTGQGVKIDDFTYGKETTGLSGQTFTFTNSLLDLQEDGVVDITEDAYRYGKDAFRIVVTRQDGTEEVYAYDLYHTGVFNYDEGNSSLRVDGQDKAGWYYYEVILMGSNYWLDRNLGATSSAYYVKEGNQGDANAAGGLYRIANAPVNDEVTLVTGNDWEAIAPKGFRVPTMTEFRALTSDRRFRQEMEGSYWGARYDTGKPDQGTVYFPKNGMWYGGAASGSGSTGYYWTQTEALGASGEQLGYWLQNMQLAGSNASGSRYRIYADGQNNPTGMSVRCVYNSRVVETQHEYECYVKGYTHVFLYNDDGNNSRTYLNAWPGDMICIYDDDALQMYHTFTFSSMVEYDNLKVVFNVVDNDGKVIETYPTDFQERGGLDLKESDEQRDKFFKKGGTGWTHTAE